MYICRHIFGYVEKANTAVTYWGLTLSFLTSVFSIAFSDKTSDSAQKHLAVMRALRLNAALSVYRNFVWSKCSAYYICKYFHQTAGYFKFAVWFIIIIIMLPSLWMSHYFNENRVISKMQKLSLHLNTHWHRRRNILFCSSTITYNILQLQIPFKIHFKPHHYWNNEMNVRTEC